MIINKYWLRILGIAGVLGGLILFLGDMLFYYHSTVTDFKMNMAQASDLRIKLSGITALLATWLYLLGLIPVYYAFKTSTVKARNVMIISFAAIVTAYGIIHGAYIAIATTAKLSAQYNLNLYDATALASDANQLLRVFVYPFFAVLSFVFIKEVWKKRTLYPRWILFFFPLFLFLIKDLIGMALSENIWTIVMGGYLNLILVVFFTASTIALWKIDPR